METTKAKTQNISTTLLYSDVLRNVFEYLDFKDVIPCMQTCKQWEKCAEEAYCWKHLYKQMFPYQVCDLKKNYYRTILPSLQNTQPPLLRYIFPLTNVYKFIFILCSCIACIGAAWTTKELYTQYSMPSTQGIIVENYISNITSINSEPVYFLNVLYTFNWDNQTYQGHTIYQDFSYTTTDYEDRLLQHLHSIVNHPIVTVYIPNEPEHAFLRHVPSIFAYILLVAPTVLLNVVFGFCIKFFPTWEKSKLEQKNIQYLSQKRFCVNTRTWIQSLETNLYNYANLTTLEICAIRKFDAFFRKWIFFSYPVILGVLIHFHLKFYDTEAPHRQIGNVNCSFAFLWVYSYIYYMMICVCKNRENFSIDKEHWQHRILWRTKTSNSPYDFIFGKKYTFQLFWKTSLFNNHPFEITNFTFKFKTKRNCGKNCGLHNASCRCADFVQEMSFSLLDNGKLFVSSTYQHIFWQGDIQLKTHFLTENGIERAYLPTSVTQNENGHIIHQNWTLYISIYYTQKFNSNTYYQEFPIQVFRDEV